MIACSWWRTRCHAGCQTRTGRATHRPLPGATSMRRSNTRAWYRLLFCITPLVGVACAELTILRQSSLSASCADRRLLDCARRVRRYHQQLRWHARHRRSRRPASGSAAVARAAWIAAHSWAADFRAHFIGEGGGFGRGLGRARSAADCPAPARSTPRRGASSATRDTQRTHDQPIGPVQERSRHSTAGVRLDDHELGEHRRAP